MDPERWQRLNELFHAALDREAQERPAFLAEACAGDAALLEEVARLVMAHAHASELIDTSAGEAAASLIAGEEQVAIGRRFGPYRVVGELGRGGMGAVYLAERADAQYVKRVALKLIKRGMDTDAMLERFRGERQILASLDHPHIARLLDGGTSADGLPYFVMELVEGQPIDAYCDNHRLSIKARLRLFLQACHAVSYAHRQLVVHRDIKLSNILVDGDGVPKLLDFGIAKIIHEDGGGHTTVTGAGLGPLTPEFASPEQVKGLRVTTATDVYSLGVVLHELLSGRAPYRFANRTHEEMARVVASVEPQSPSDAALMPPDAAGAPPTPAAPDRAAARAESSPARLSRRLRGDLDTIVHKALRKEPERRYLSVEQMAEDIRRHLDGRPVIARNDTLAYRAAKFVRRNKGAVAAALIVCGTLVAGIAATTWQARRATAEQALAQRRFDDVRKLVRSVLFDYHDAIKDLPGATPVRARLVRDALEYLEALARDAGGDQSLRRELASAYQKVGEVQGGTLFANLGDTAGAIASNRKALALREAVIAEDPQNRDALRDVATSHRQLGMLLWETGDVAGALDNIRRALAGFRALAPGAPSGSDLRYDLADAYDKVGMILQETGDTAGALENYREAQRIHETAGAGHPENPRDRRGLSVVHERIGTLFLQTGDLEAALASNRRAFELRAGLVAEFPLNADYRRTLLVSYYNDGEILASMGRNREALDSYRKDLAIAAELSQSDPDNEQYRGDLAYALIRVGDMSALLGNSTQALTSYRRSLELRSQDVEADPDNLWKRASLIEAHAKITKTLAKAGQDAAASTVYADTVSLMEDTAIEPTNVLYRTFFANTYMNLGEAQAVMAGGAGTPAARGARWRSARAMYQRSLELWRDLRDRGILDSVEVNKIDVVAGEIARCDRMLRTQPRADTK